MEVAELAHLRRARDLLDREYARPLDVPAMARAALMSPSLFSRRFREAYGDTPYGYLQARRVERAMALLRYGHMPVSDVCMAVGFTSLGSFSSTFTRLVGEPPSVYDLLLAAVDHHIPPADRQTMREIVAKGDLPVFIQVDDLDKTFESLRAAGTEILQEPVDQPYGVRDAAIRDPSGNHLRLSQPLPTQA